MEILLDTSKRLCKGKCLFVLNLYTATFSKPATYHTTIKHLCTVHLQRADQPIIYFNSCHSNESVFSYLGHRYNNEGAPTSALGDDCHELGIDGTEVVVMDVLSDGDTVEAVLPVGYLSIYISKLGASVGRTP